MSNASNKSKRWLITGAALAFLAAVRTADSITKDADQNEKAQTSEIKQKEPTQKTTRTFRRSADRLAQQNYTIERPLTVEDLNNALNSAMRANESEEHLELKIKLKTPSGEIITATIYDHDNGDGIYALSYIKFALADYAVDREIWLDRINTGLETVLNNTSFAVLQDHLFDTQNGSKDFPISLSELIALARVSEFENGPDMQNIISGFMSGEANSQSTIIYGSNHNIPFTDMTIMTVDETGALILYSENKGPHSVADLEISPDHTVSPDNASFIAQHASPEDRATIIQNTEISIEALQSNATALFTAAALEMMHGETPPSPETRAILQDRYEQVWDVILQQTGYPDDAPIRQTLNYIQSDPYIGAVTISTLNQIIADYVVPTNDEGLPDGRPTPTYNDLVLTLQDLTNQINEMREAEEAPQLNGPQIEGGF